MHDSCITTKTITLEIDAYEKLRLAKDAGESFSAAVRRVRFGNEPLRGADLLAYLRTGGSGIGEDYLKAVEDAMAKDSPPDDPWA